MALEGLFIKVTHLSTVTGPLLLSDVESGFDYLKTGTRSRTPGPVYVPAGSSVYLALTSSVLLSYESGAIRQWVDSGHIRATMVGGATKVLTFLYDYSVLGGTLSAKTLTAVNGDALQLPAYCGIVRGWVEVVTAVTSAGGANVSIGKTGTAAAFRAATAKATLADNALLAFNGSVVHNGTEAAAPVCVRNTTAVSVTATPDTTALNGGKFYVHFEIIPGFEP